MRHAYIPGYMHIHWGITKIQLTYLCCYSGSCLVQYLYCAINIEEDLICKWYLYMCDLVTSVAEYHYLCSACQSLSRGLTISTRRNCSNIWRESGFQRLFISSELVKWSFCRGLVMCGSSRTTSPELKHPEPRSVSRRAPSYFYHTF